MSINYTPVTLFLLSLKKSSYAAALFYFRPGLLLVAPVSEHYLLLHRQRAVGLPRSSRIRSANHLLINLVSRPELNGERKAASSVDFSTPTVIISHSLDS